MPQAQLTPQLFDDAVRRLMPCPSWCSYDLRQDSTTEPRTHPDDFTTWHHSDAKRVEVRRPLSTTALAVTLELFDPDLKEPTDPGTEIQVEGADGSGNICGLRLPVDTAEQLALVILNLAKAARA